MPAHWTKQQNYATIEKELLAIAFACNKFHDYVFAKSITVETDHKPLLGIMSKPIHLLSARLQCIHMRLQRYNVRLQYKPGKDMIFADMLSRAYLIDVEANELYDKDLEVCTIQATTQKIRQLQDETQSDTVLIKLAKTLTDGWPETISKIEPELKTYFIHRDEISQKDGLLFKGMRIILPKEYAI